MQLACQDLPVSFTPTSSQSVKQMFSLICKIFELYYQKSTEAKRKTEKYGIDIKEITTKEERHCSYQDIACFGKIELPSILKIKLQLWLSLVKEQYLFQDIAVTSLQESEKRYMTQL